MLLATERAAEVRLLPALRRRVAATPVIAIDLGPFTAADGAAARRGNGRDRSRAASRRRSAAPAATRCFSPACSPDPADGRLPTSIVALVQEQTDRLADAPRAVLRQAAVLGQSFLPDDYAHAFGAAAFGDLVAAGFLARDRDRLAFVHALVHEAIYASITRADRRRMHADAARMLSRQRPGALGRPRARRRRARRGGRLHRRRRPAAAPARLRRPESATSRRASRRPQRRRPRAATDLPRQPPARDRRARRGAGRLRCGVGGRACLPSCGAQALVRQAWVHRLRGALDAGDAGARRGARPRPRRDLGGHPRRDREPARRPGLRPRRPGRQPAPQRARARPRPEPAAAQPRARRARRRPLRRRADGLGAASVFGCIALAQANGLGVVEVGYISMEAESLKFADPGPEVLATLERALYRTREAGNARAELQALHILGEVLIEACEFDRAAAVLAEAGWLRHPTGRSDTWQARLEAVVLAEVRRPVPRRKRVSQDRGSPRCPRPRLGRPCRACGPGPRPGRFRRLLAEGEARLAEAGVGYIQLSFRRLAAEALLESRRLGGRSGAGRGARALRRPRAAEMVRLRHPPRPAAAESGPRLGR